MLIIDSKYILMYDESMQEGGPCGPPSADASFKGGFLQTRLHSHNGIVGQGVRFERIRRVTGYLVGSLDRFNDAKRQEVRDRVRHGHV